MPWLSLCGFLHSDKKSGKMFMQTITAIVILSMFSQHPLVFKTSLYCIICMCAFLSQLRVTEITEKVRWEQQFRGQESGLNKHLTIQSMNEHHLPLEI